jgi:hypothetical protein
MLHCKQAEPAAADYAQSNHERLLKVKVEDPPGAE